MTLFLKDLQKVRELLTPEQAAQVPNLFPKLKENKEIKKGQRFNKNGIFFEAHQNSPATKTSHNQQWGKSKNRGGR
jgi:hypothetical protein